MAIITSKSKKFLKTYLDNASPTGYEASGQKLWLDYIGPYIDDWRSDNYGTVYAMINPGQDFKVVIESHADEISWFVNHITEKGYIHVIRNGGSDQVIAASRKVHIHTKKGIVKGVFGWPAIHTRRGKELNMSPTLDNIFIDIGAKDKKDAEKMGVHIGCVITYEESFDELNNRHFIGRALDNRIGGFCVAEVARLLKKDKVNLPFSLYIVNAVQEEVGLRGAQMIAETIQPNIALVTDVTHDTHTPLVSAKKHGDVELGKGPCLAYAPSVHNILLEMIINAAEKNKIPFQRSASSRSTGTDTDAFAYSNGGVPSALISLPLRYMHTTVEMAHYDDVENVIRLIYETLKVIDPGQSFKYL